MRRCAFIFFLLSLCAVISVDAADRNIKRVQKQLRKEGFYFGKTTGVYDVETSTAVSRYQIRKGLPITGRLDDETTKALGVGPPDEPAVRPPDRETWSHLREQDAQFLQKLNARKRVTAITESQPPPEGYSSVVVLSPERLRDYVGAFILAGLDPQVGAELEFFGEEVRYFDEGVIDRPRIQRDLVRYNQRWPERRFWLAGEVSVEPQPDSRVRVTFPLGYDLRNGEKRAAGKVLKRLVLEVPGTNLQIVGVDEQKLN